MYGHDQPMSITSQIADDGDDVAGGGVVESVDDHHHHLIPYDAHDLDDAGDDVHHDSVYSSGAGAGNELLVHRGDGSSQLTLSFRGQVYVFDTVTPEKVQAVLLLLGGCEVAGGAQGVGLSAQNSRAMVEIPSRCSLPQRAASLNRFRQKRKLRCFDKKVRYCVRQEVALKMQRNKGQFTSKKSEGGYGWGDATESGQDDNPLETFCTHCGISSKATPMMRRGPSGPRSLCNACGLFWANKGTLRDVSKKTHDHSHTPVDQAEGEARDSNCETTIQTHKSIASFGNSDSSALMAEQ